MGRSRISHPTKRWRGDDFATTLPLRRADSIDEYLANPFGRYVAGPTFVAYWSSPNLNGISFWGRPDEEHISTVTRALDAVLMPRRPHHRALIDARHLSGVDAGAFSLLVSYMIKHRATHARLCTRQALLRPGGFPGAIVAGFYVIVEPGYPVKVFDDVDAALAWLGIPGGLALVQELDRIRASFANSSELFLSEVRALLDQEPKRATIQVAAARLAVSERTLQRRLTQAGSSFRDELAAAHLRLAKELLSHGRHSVKEVAGQIGYASVSQFSTFFRRMTGIAPVAWLKSERLS